MSSTIVNVTYEARHFGDLVVVKAPQGWRIPARGWQELGSSEKGVLAYQFVTDLFAGLPPGIESVRVYRGVNPLKPVQFTAEGTPASGEEEGAVSQEWTDTFNGDGAGTWAAKAPLGSENAVWFSSAQPGPTEVSVTCKVCGHVVTVREGDAPIPYGDPVYASTSDSPTTRQEKVNE